MGLMTQYLEEKKKEEVGGSLLFSHSRFMRDTFVLTFGEYEKIQVNVDNPILELDPNKDWYFPIGIQPTEIVNHDRKRGGIKSCLGSSTFYLEIDLKHEDLDDAESIEAKKKETVEKVFSICNNDRIPKPTTIVDSGYGVHCYFNLSSVVRNIKLWEEIQTNLIGHFRRNGLSIDEQCKDISRVLRVPGTFNNKYGRQVPVKILHITTRSPLHIEQFYEFTMDEELQFHSSIGDRIGKHGNWSGTEYVGAGEWTPISWIDCEVDFNDVQKKGPVSQPEKPYHKLAKPVEKVIASTDDTKTVVTPVEVITEDKFGNQVVKTSETETEVKVIATQTECGLKLFDKNYPAYALIEFKKSDLDHYSRHELWLNLCIQMAQKGFSREAMYSKGLEFYEFANLPGHGNHEFTLKEVYDLIDWVEGKIDPLEKSATHTELQQVKAMAEKFSRTVAVQFVQRKSSNLFDIADCLFKMFFAKYGLESAISQHTVAEIMGLNQSTVSKNMKKLVSLGVIEKTDSHFFIKGKYGAGKSATYRLIIEQESVVDNSSNELTVDDLHQDVFELGQIEEISTENDAITEADFFYSSMCIIEEDNILSYKNNKDLNKAFIIERKLKNKEIESKDREKEYSSTKPLLE